MKTSSNPISDSGSGILSRPSSNSPSGSLSSPVSDPLLSQGVVFLVIIILIISAAFAVMALNAPDDDDDNDEPWEPTPHQPYITPQFSGIIARDFVEAQLDFGYRYPGSQGIIECRDYIRDTMEEFGYVVEYQNFTYNDTEGYNIIARDTTRARYYSEINGDNGNRVHAGVNGNKNPVKSTLILGAHYDTRPFSEKDEPYDIPVLGANDGASGVAVLLELARVLSVRPVDYNLEFVFFDFEDSGGGSLEFSHGSRVYAESLTDEDIQYISGAIIVDMIGDSDLDIYLEKNSNPDLRDSIWKEAEKLGYHEFHKSEKYPVIDDHIRLRDVGVPAALLIDFDYPHWHTQNDTLDKISSESLEKVGQVLERYIYTISDYQKQKADTSDLIIEEGEILTLDGNIDGQVLHVNGNVIINGTLDLQDILLIVNGESGYERLLNITGTGKLNLRNSIVTSPHQSLIFTDHGSLEIEGSILENLWGDTGMPPYRGGVQIFNPDFSILDSIFRSSETRGLFIQDAMSDPAPSVESCTFEDNGEVGLFISNSRVKISDSIFRGNGRGAIIAEKGGLELDNGTILYHERLGTCTTGDCGGPEPSFGIMVTALSEDSSVMDTSFTDVDTGIDAAFIDWTKGSLTVDNVSIQNADFGLELLNTSAEIIHCRLEELGIGVSIQDSFPVIRDTLITDTYEGIRAIASGGIIRANIITDSENMGINLVGSSTSIENNTITGANYGVYSFIDGDRYLYPSQHSGAIGGNVIANNTYGIFIEFQDDLVNVTIRDNIVYQNDWAIRYIGNGSKVLRENNTYEKDEMTNIQGIVKGGQFVTLKFMNATDDFFLSITKSDAVIYSQYVSIWTHQVTINLTVFEIHIDLSEHDLSSYTVMVDHAGCENKADIDVKTTQELSFDLSYYTCPS